MHEVSLVVMSEGYSSLWFTGFSLRRLLLLQSTDAIAWTSVAAALGSVVVTQT